MHVRRERGDMTTGAEDASVSPTVWPITSSSPIRSPGIAVSRQVRSLINPHTRPNRSAGRIGDLGEPKCDFRHCRHFSCLQRCHGCSYRGCKHSDGRVDAIFELHVRSRVTLGMVWKETIPIHQCNSPYGVPSTFSISLAILSGKFVSCSSHRVGLTTITSRRSSKTRRFWQGRRASQLFRLVLVAVRDFGHHLRLFR